MAHGGQFALENRGQLSLDNGDQFEWIFQLYSSEAFRDFVKYAVLGYVQYFSYAMLYFMWYSPLRRNRYLENWKRRS